MITYFKAESTKEMIKKIEPALELLDRYNHPYYLVPANYVGEIVDFHSIHSQCGLGDFFVFF